VDNCVAGRLFNAKAAYINVPDGKDALIDALNTSLPNLVTLQLTFARTYTTTSTVLEGSALKLTHMSLSQVSLDHPLELTSLLHLLLFELRCISVLKTLNMVLSQTLCLQRLYLENLTVEGAAEGPIQNKAEALKVGLPHLEVVQPTANSALLHELFHVIPPPSQQLHLTWKGPHPHQPQTNSGIYRRLLYLWQRVSRCVVDVLPNGRVGLQGHSSERLRVELWFASWSTLYQKGHKTALIVSTAFFRDCDVLLPLSP
jgi:hypothetical protein